MIQDLPGHSIDQQFRQLPNYYSIIFSSLSRLCSAVFETLSNNWSGCTEKCDSISGSFGKM